MKVLSATLPVLAVLLLIAAAPDYWWALLLLAAVAGLVAYGYNGYRAARRACPECAGTIKARARRCRHCGQPV